MSIASGRYQLANAFKSLKQEWEATENVWRDVVRQDFAEHHFDPLADAAVVGADGDGPPRPGAGADEEDCE